MGFPPTAGVADWSQPPDTLALGPDDVHVWHLSLEQPSVVVAWLRKSLSEDELERAARYRYEHDRLAFVVARGVLRRILCRYLAERPEQILFRYGLQGKPALAGDFQACTLHFNLSHSRGVALLAITRQREIGVDIEWVQPELEIDKLAEQICSPGERAILRSLPGASRREAFFRVWTCKEAFIKATGEGLLRPLDTIDVSLAPGEPARLLACQGDTQAATRWSLEELRLGPNYCAALAVEGTGWHLSCCLWACAPDF